MGPDRFLLSLPGIRPALFLLPFRRQAFAGQIEKRQWFLCPQAEYLYDADNKLLVDFVGRFESLAQDFASACQHMGMSNATLPHVNDSKRARPGVMRWITRPSLPYRDMYNTHSQQVVASLYEADVEAFKYRF